MSAFANLPISRKLLAAFAAVLAVIIACSAVVYDRLRIIDEAERWRLHTTNVLETLQKALDAMLDQETGVRGYLISGEEAFLEPYHKGTEAFVATMWTLENITSDNASQQGRLDELGELAKQWRSEIAERQIALMSKAETRGDARALEGAGDGKRAMDSIRAKVDEIRTVERGLLEERVAEQRKAFATAYTVTILGGATSLAVATLMGTLLTRSITGSITRMTGAMTALATGDTGVDVPGVGRKDEIGAMAEAVQVFRDSIIERLRAQAGLAHVNRVATMGQLTASIAHEVNQPISAAVTNAQAALRWLGAQPADLDEVRQALSRIVEDGKRASDVIGRIRALIKKAPPRKGWFDLNEAVLDVITLTRSEVDKHDVWLKSQFTRGLPLVEGDRVQLQQVILNLIMNAVEAMRGVEGPRELQVITEVLAEGDVLVSVRDSGPGLDPKSVTRIFEAFYTTKAEGMGMGLAICQSIIEAHAGRLWATANQPRGAVFQFNLPAARSETFVAQHADHVSAA